VGEIDDSEVLHAFGHVQCEGAYFGKAGTCKGCTAVYNLVRIAKYRSRKTGKINFYPNIDFGEV